MANCKLCAWLCKWLYPASSNHSAYLDDISAKWEQAHSNAFDMWDKEPDKEKVNQARALFATDPAAALQIYRELAEQGSALSMRSLGYCYCWGRGVTADVHEADEWYRKAISAGSWIAVLERAKVLSKYGYKDECDQSLADGVKKGWAPAYYWQAWFRYKHAKSRKTCRQIRPLLEYAAEQGHPRAQYLLAFLMARGNFGLREIRRGGRLLLAFMARTFPDAVVETNPTVTEQIDATATAS